MKARLLVIAVAVRLPAWAESACAEYLKRMPRGFETRRVAVKPESRTGAKPLERMLASEADRILAATPSGARLVALDERGADLTTAQFAGRLRGWVDEGRATAFVIGGPDGLERGLLARCTVTLRLSSLTLPHALAQVLLCEQLYRAASLLTGHPYHRE
jgi:23S rRNA (pseudouridine1915-N3)-methyltransferase